MARRRIATIGVGALLTGLLAGCATAPPPRELVQARQTYQRAASSPVHERIVADLREARIAIENAERLNNDSSTAPETRDVSYIALRKAELALANANAYLAQDMQAQAEQQAQVLRERKERLTREEMIRMREQIAGQTRDLQARADELKERQTAFSQAQEELRRREQELQEARDKASESREQMAGTKAQLAMQEQQLSQRQRELEAERAARAEAERKAQMAMNNLRALGAVREDERGIVLTLSGAVLFPFGKSTLLPIAQERLSQVAEVLKQNPGQKITIEGHTDSVGSDAQNQTLSVARAEAVRSYLVSRGLPTDSIQAVGHGESRPLVDNSNPENRANNRRVEIVIPRQQPRGMGAPGIGSGMQDQGGSMQQQGGGMQQGGSMQGQQPWQSPGSAQPGTDQGAPMRGEDLQKPGTPPSERSPKGSEQQGPSPTTPPEKVQQPGSPQ